MTPVSGSHRGVSPVTRGLPSSTPQRDSIPHRNTKWREDIPTRPRLCQSGDVPQETNPDLAKLLAEANDLHRRLDAGDLSVARSLAEVERRLAALAATVGLPG